MASACIYTAHDDHVLCRTRGALYILAEDNGRTMGALRGVYARILPPARMASPLRKVSDPVVVFCPGLLGGSSLALYGRCAAEPEDSPIRPHLISEGAGTLEVCRYPNHAAVYNVRVRVHNDNYILPPGRRIMGYVLRNDLVAHVSARVA